MFCCPCWRWPRAEERRGRRPRVEERPLVPMAEPRLGPERLQAVLGTVPGFQELLLKSWDETRLFSERPEEAAHLEEEELQMGGPVTLVVRGPYVRGSRGWQDGADDEPETEDADKDLEALSSLLLDQVDLEAVQIVAMVLEDVAIDTEIAQWVVDIASAGYIRLLCLVRCQLDIPTLLSWALFQTSTVECLAVKNCNWADAHLEALGEAGRRDEHLLTHLRCLHLTGTFSRPVMDAFVQGLDCLDPLQLEALYVPAKFAEAVRGSALAERRPALRVNGQQDRTSKPGATPQGRG